LFKSYFVIFEFDKKVSEIIGIVAYGWFKPLGQ